MLINSISEKDFKEIKSALFKKAEKGDMDAIKKFRDLRKEEIQKLITIQNDLDHPLGKRNLSETYGKLLKDKKTEKIKQILMKRAKASDLKATNLLERICEDEKELKQKLDEAIGDENQKKLEGISVEELEARLLKLQEKIKMYQKKVRN